LIHLEQQDQTAGERLSPPAAAALVRRARSGDERAWARLVAEYERLLWAVARAHRLSEQDAADAVQAAWVKLVEHLDDLHEPSRVGAWLATTTRRECLRLLRRGGAEALLGDAVPELPSTDEAPGESLLQIERDDALRHAFERLRPSDQALLRLLTADPQPSYEEISAALDMPIGSIGPTRGRALERLRAELERDRAIELIAA
jgi:RNA polymerase sigma factor (sigma-70 family)